MLLGLSTAIQYIKKKLMNVLIIGSGGREHALAWKIKQSPLLKTLHALPGSAGISEIAECAQIPQNDFEMISKYCAENQIDVIVIGPEEPLAKGITDFLSAKGFKVFGPSHKGSVLEASKQFAKEFMSANNIPSAGFEVLYDVQSAREKIKCNKNYPIVLKADGLAQGKGVRICKNEEESLDTVSDFMEKRIFGLSGSKIILEEFLTGKEASVMAFVDGNSFLMLPVSRDHKRLLDNNEGANTGGMGAICPVQLDEQITQIIKKEILERFVEGIKKWKIPYCGIIYAGLMLTSNGPKVLEFNVRFGDPETEAVLPLIKSDLLEIIKACIDGKLSSQKIETENKVCVDVVLASKGYPENPEKGKSITGIENFKDSKDIILFHSGIKKENDKYLTNGGRVLNVAGTGFNIEEARNKVYSAISQIHFEGMHFRKDIGIN